MTTRETAARLAAAVAGPHATDAMIDRLLAMPELLRVAATDMQTARALLTADATRTLAAYTAAATTDDRRIA